jgi:hypothetical protein
MPIAFILMAVFDLYADVNELHFDMELNKIKMSIPDLFAPIAKMMLSVVIRHFIFFNFFIVLTLLKYLLKILCYAQLFYPGKKGVWRNIEQLSSPA